MEKKKVSLKQRKQRNKFKRVVKKCKKSKDFKKCVSKGLKK